MPIHQINIRTSIVLLLAGAGATLALLGGVAPADALAGCNHSTKQPDALSSKQARSAVNCLINKERNQHGKGDYSSDSRLVNAAEKHSSVMASKSCFSHECPGERSLLGRLQGVGYIVGGLTSWAYGENIAYGDDGRGTPREIVQAWMNSPPHRSAILSGTFQEMGTGFESRGDRGYYTTDFGLRRG